MALEPGELFLGSVTSKTNEHHLRSFFKTYGKVVDAVIKEDRTTNYIRRVGFITFRDPAVADRVVDGHHLINGKLVKAKKVVPIKYWHLLDEDSSIIQQYAGCLSSPETIYITGLTSTVKKSDLKNYFDQFGKITDIVLVCNHNKKDSLNSGFITYDSGRAVRKVLRQTRHVMNGRTVKVKSFFHEELSPGPTRTLLSGSNHGLDLDKDKNGSTDAAIQSEYEATPESDVCYVELADLDGSHSSSIVYAKNRAEMKRFEETEDCFILDFDPKEKQIKPLAEMKAEGFICPSKRVEPNGSPVRYVACVKNKAEMKRLEKSEECFILDFDPDDFLDISKLSLSDNLHNAPNEPDLLMVAEKGQVACRDFPHSRHLCVKYPFGKTSHESFCKLCYCYVCEKAAPCKYWTGLEGHCHTVDDAAGMSRRREMRYLL